MQCDGFHIKGSDFGANAPGVRLLIKMKGPGKRIVHQPPSRWIVGASKNGSYHVAVGLVRLLPGDHDVRTVTSADLPERDLHDRGPCCERLAYRRSFGILR